MVSLLIAVALLALAEIALRIGDYGYPTTRFVQDAQISPALWRDNQAFARRFFPGPWLPDTAPTQLAVAPEKNVLRVAVLGESAAYGYPDPAFGFPRMLEVMLAAAYPERKVELINAALSGASSPVLREEFPDVLRLHPDVVVLYIGNNEFIGPFAPSNDTGVLSNSDFVLRTRVLASRLRLAQWVGRLGSAPPTGAASDAPARCIPLEGSDSRVIRTHDRYEANLRAMLALAAEAKIPVVLCTVAVNERDCSPFGAGHPALGAEALKSWQALYDAGVTAWDQGDARGALQAWKEAEAIDATTAILAYRVGKACEALGDAAAAAEGYDRACTLDIVRYRVSPEMNARIRRLGAETDEDEVLLADCAAEVSGALEKGGGKSSLFYDACHLTVDGNEIVARCIAKAMAKHFSEPAAVVPTSEELRARIGWSPWHARENLRYVKLLTARAPYLGRFDYDAWARRRDEDIAALDPLCTPAALAPVATQLAALQAAHPDDPFLARNLAQVRAAAGDGQAAAEMLDTLVATFPKYDAAWALLGRTRAETRDFPKAVVAWRRATALRPERQDWRIGLGEALFASGDYPAARVEWRRLADFLPDNEQVWWRLGGTYAGEKNYVEAVKTYREALTHLPGHPKILYSLAKALMASGDTENARATLIEGLRVAPDDSALKSLGATFSPPVVEAPASN